MSKAPPTTGLFLVAPPASDEALLAAVERALHGDSTALAELPALTNLALTDAFVASAMGDPPAACSGLGESPTSAVGLVAAWLRDRPG